ncbi:Cellulose binding domain-containing protein [Lentzea fradiae]|uniref:Cellulose binding domain-containing protein n=1 Tax=Lentzea fradiae TaxID=200378 RepID=A0A1G7Z822_9PSEU|nr:cellulose binding domain-containing protein [Lentzea fradiae]SDH04270.1 Cellulose binding domain-containing protein [Lentzea fradiae]
MKKFRWQFLAAAVAVATAVGGLAVAPASGATGVTAAFTKTSDWGSGYEAKYTISNSGGSALSSWTVEFTLPGGQSIASLWDGSYAANGQNITVRSTWNGSVPVGGSVSFGFTVRGSGGAPSNCKINGGSCDGGGQQPTTTTTTTTTTTSNQPVPGTGRGAPYLYLGWGNPQNATQVMRDSGVKWFTLAFVLSGGGCTPSWDSSRPLTGGVDEQTINAIRAAGGDIVPSFGGWSGNKLGPNCSTPEALAGAYQQVIDAYRLKAIDIDIENSDEFENAVVQDRILTALKIVKQRNPGIQTIVTFGTGTTGPNYYGARLIDQAKALNANIDVFTIMPFDFNSSNIRTDTIAAATGLKNKLKSVFGWSDAEAFKHVGISGMNGLSDHRELTTVDDWTAIRDWSKANGLGRLAFWSVNRDRGGCDGQVAAHCSGIQQGDLAFSKITAGF